jgi:hypothetical protein
VDDSSVVQVRVKFETVPVLPECKHKLLPVRFPKLRDV